MRKLNKILDELDIPILIIDKSYNIVFLNSEAKKFLTKFYERKKIKCYQLFYNQDCPCFFCPISYLNEENKKISFGLLSEKENFLLFEYIYLKSYRILILMKEVKKELPFEQRLKRFLENLPIVVLVLKNRRILYVNSFFEKSLGFSFSEVVDLDFIENLVSEEEKIIVELYYQRALIDLKEEKIIFSLYTKEKKIRTFMWNVFLLKEEGLVVFTGIDVTEFLQAKTKLEDLHKSQTFSNFLKSLVHDFNNILQNTNTYILKIRENLNYPEKINEYLNFIESLLSSWIDLNRILLGYLKEVRDLKSKYIDMISFLKENLELFQLIAGENINLYLDLDYFSSAWVPGDASLWRYIFLNFITNARDAIEHEGNIFINLKTIFDRNRGLNFLIISIKDTGCGIAPENLRKIFTPFFTTKDKGSGLGLFLVNSHIKNLGGYIEVESEVNKGSIFKIFVPLLEKKSLREKKQEKLPEYKKIKILLVEDDEEIKNFLETFVKQKNYEVVAYSDPKEVLRDLEKLKDIDLLITDLNLKEYSGEKLYEILKKQIPYLKVLYLSGDIFSMLEIPEERLLLKPFNIEDFYHKIEKILTKIE